MATCKAPAEIIGDAAQVNAAVTNATEAFSSHYAQLDAGMLQCHMRILKMNGSTMLIIGDKKSNRLDELAMAIPARAPSTEILATSFMGDHGQSDSLVLATKLSKRHNRQFYVSMNVQLDPITRPLFEKSLFSYMREHLKLFV